MTEARTALVTGAATGLGRATALALGRAGFDLALADLDADWLREVAAHPDLRGRKAVALALDLRAEDSIAQAMAQAAEALGVIDVLVNNAGVPLQRPATEVTWAEWDAVIDVNLKGSYFLATAFARHCRGRGGAVISIASTHGLTGIADRSVYGISKGGIIQMTRMLAIEWAPLGIRVNAIAPATVLTPSREKILSDPEARARMLARIPLGRFPEADEIAAAVCYLASDAARSITGHTLVIDGGLTAM